MYITYGNFASCIDLVAAVIDSTNVELTPYDKLYLLFPPDRLSLVDGVIYRPDEVRAIVDRMAQTYISAQSTYNKLKIDGAQQKNTFIYVDVTTTAKELAWAENRADIILPDNVIDYTKLPMDAYIDRLYVDHVILLSDIIEGRLIEKLREFIPPEIELNEVLYQGYLQMLHLEYPF